MKQFLLFLFLLFCTNIIAQETTTAVFPFAKDQKWGIIDANKNVILAPKYSLINFFEFHKNEEAVAFVKNESNKYGIINRKGAEIIAPAYDKIYGIQQNVRNVVRASKDGKMGLLSLDTGTPITAFEYDAILNFSEGSQPVAIVRRDKKHGIISTTGKVIAAPIYKNAYHIGMDEEGGTVTKFITQDGKTIAMNAKGVVVSEIERENIAFMDMSIDEKNIAKPKFTQEYTSVEGVSGILLKITHPYAKAPYEHFLAGYNHVLHVDAVMEQQDETPSFNLLIGAKDDEVGIVNGQFEVLTPFKFNGYKKQRNQTYILHKNGLKGLANKDGKMIYDAVFSSILFLRFKDRKNEYFSIQTPAGYSGYADFEGNVFLPE